MNTKNTEKSDVALREEEIFAFWRERNIFNKSIETPAGKVPTGDFVFYDGPPFATGLPHYGHILAGTVKDAIPRFQTMNGKRVIRKWGWDCHGLPVENLVEKKLGLATKRDIEKHGIKQFNESARDSVMEYADDWRRIIPRMGRFIDMDDDYKTMDPNYTESVWWVFSELNKKGLVYEDFKSMHFCPRCGTTLSNFEVNLGYKEIKDIAVTVKMPLLDTHGMVTDTAILIWTTTPWTLPGNLAVAVNKDIEYVKVRVKINDRDELVVLAKKRLAQLGTEDYEILETMKGDNLVGKSYKPPFDYLEKQEIDCKENAWKIYHADYVEIGEEGTGAVHIAPAYGEEDINLAKQNNIPVIHHVDTDGRFEVFVTDFKGQLVKPKDDDTGVTHLAADIEVIKSLKEKNVLIRKENITHSYPHCWRCETPLINYATTSWFVRVTEIRDELIAENSKVKWIPNHVGRNRFGKWLEGTRDWAISRQRYWGAPLPIWKNEKTGETKIMGSLEELKTFVSNSNNTFVLIRHGESVFNTRGILNGKAGTENRLTERGKEQVQRMTDVLNKESIDYIYYSPLERTAETAKLIAKVIGVPDDRLIADVRILEIQFGGFEGKHIDEYHLFFGSGENRLTKCHEGGETWTDVKQRVGDFLYSINKKHKDAKILIVSHNGPLQLMQAVACGDSFQRTAQRIDENSYDIDNAEVRTLSFTPIPHNEKYELDFHRPYIDEIELIDTDGAGLARVSDVFDCWFESGAMPYAQNHYPFKTISIFEPKNGVGYPAQFIAEGLDQTRGWFYSLIVLGTALFGRSPFESVIVNGLILAEDGKKMSKSLKNYPDPMEIADRTGVDALRFYLLSSSVVSGEDLNFSERGVGEVQRKNIGRLHNILLMYEMFANTSVLPSTSKKHILDRWIISRLNETVHNITQGYMNYELEKATRPIEGFIDDLSVWYLRRSRDRLKGEDIEDKNACLSTLRHSLKTLALIMAPVMPFYSEYLFLRVREEGDAESVHLMSWPKSEEVDETLLVKMQKTRDVVSNALEARSSSNIKVRQPLQTLYFNPDEVTLDDETIKLIKSEVNVKNVIAKTNWSEDSVVLDMNITHELKHEGEIRELIRAIQDVRKQLGLKSRDSVVLLASLTTKELIGSFEPEVLRTIGAHEVHVEKTNLAHSITINGVSYDFDVHT